MPRVNGKVQTRSARARIWRVIRSWQGEFTYADVCQVAEVEYVNAIIYLKLLLKAGYIRQTRKVLKNPRGGKKQNVFMLVRNTGPLPPVQSQLTMVYDPNKDEYWVEDVDGVCKRVRADLVKQGVLK